MKPACSGDRVALGHLGGGLMYLPCLCCYWLDIPSTRTRDRSMTRPPRLCRPPIATIRPRLEHRSWMNSRLCPCRASSKCSLATGSAMTSIATTAWSSTFLAASRTDRGSSARCSCSGASRSTSSIFFGPIFFGPSRPPAGMPSRTPVGAISVRYRARARCSRSAYAARSRSRQRGNRRSLWVDPSGSIHLDRSFWADRTGSIQPCQAKPGAPGGTRTPDPLVRSQVL